jgi:hypothetical protein
LVCLSPAEVPVQRTLIDRHKNHICDKSGLRSQRSLPIARFGAREQPLCH